LCDKYEQMNYFSSNLKVLRSFHKHSQQYLADCLNVSRANLAKYEGGVHEPSFSVLIGVARFFNVSIDVLLLHQITEKQLVEKDELIAPAVKVIPIQVNDEGDDIIEVVSHSAQAGYLGMYGDPNYIEQLDNMSIPFLKSKGKCRAFPISGDSMPPFEDGSYVIGEYVDRLEDVRSGERYIVLTRDQGILFKRWQFQNENKQRVQLISDNPKYDPILIDLTEIVELWAFEVAITSSENVIGTRINDVLNKVKNLQKDLESLTSI